MKTFTKIVVALFSLCVITLMFIGFDSIQAIANKSEGGNDITLNLFLTGIDLVIFAFGALMIMWAVYLTYTHSNNIQKA